MSQNSGSPVRKDKQHENHLLIQKHVNVAFGSKIMVLTSVHISQTAIFGKRKAQQFQDISFALYLNHIDFCIKHFRGNDLFYLSWIKEHNKKVM